MKILRTTTIEGDRHGSPSFSEAQETAPRKPAHATSRKAPLPGNRVKVILASERI